MMVSTTSGTSLFCIAALAAIASLAVVDGKPCNCPGSNKDNNKDQPPSAPPPPPPPPPGSLRIYGNVKDPSNGPPVRTQGAEFKYEQTYRHGIKVGATAGIEHSSQTGTDKKVGVQVSIPLP